MCRRSRGTKAAEHGEAIASFTLGSIYESGADRVGRDEAKAATWYRKAAGQGLGTAQHRLALMYRDGRGVSRDTAEAIAWFRKAADRGEADAQIELGVLLSPGHGAVSDIIEAHLVQPRGVAMEGRGRRVQAANLRDELEKTMTPGSARSGVSPRD